MKKLKLQMQITVDGYVAGPEGQLDWMTSLTSPQAWQSDEKLLAFINHLTDTSDTILMGRKMAPGFLQYWEGAVTRAESRERAFAQKMVSYPKVVFSKTISEIKGQNVRVENGDATEAINRLKRGEGKDIIVYGGATFVRSLLASRLIDELNVFVNPVAIGKGMQVFADRYPLKLAGSTRYDSGLVVNTYRPQ